MKKIICGLLLLSLCSGFVSAQAKPESMCDRTPLECAVSLLKAENRLVIRDEEISWISRDYWNLGRKSEALQALELFDEGDNENKITTLVDFADDALKKGNIYDAAEILTRAFEFQEDFDDLDEFSVKRFASDLVEAGLEAKISELLSPLDEYEKSLSLIEISKAFWKKGDYLKTLEMLSEAGNHAIQIEANYKKKPALAEIGRQYIEIGELKKGFEFLDSALDYVDQDSDVLEPVFAAYLKAGEYEKALDLVKNYPDFTKSEIAYYSANTYFHAANKPQSLNILRQTANYESEIAADAKKGLQYTFLVDVVKLYLKWNEPALALEATKAMKYEKAQQFSFIEISTYYRENGKPAESSKVIEAALERAKNIKDNGDNQSDLVRDDYLANLGDESIDAENYVLAEKIVRAVEKKYFRGGGFAALVYKNKKYSPVKIRSMLDEGRILFQKNTSSHRPLDRIRLWAILAHGYAQNGQKEKARAVFAEILTSIANDDKMSDSERIKQLSTAGYWFEKADLTVGENIVKPLQKIAAVWIAENVPEEK